MNKANRRKFHYIYKITRDDGKYYIGLHSTDDLDDGYFGSGRVLWRSIKAHGKTKHTKEILEFLPSREQLIAREVELVTEDQLADSACMNLRLGGSYPYRKPDSPEGGKRKSEALRRFYDDREKSAAARKAVSDGNKGKKLSQTHKEFLSLQCTETVKRLKATGEWANVVAKNAAAHTGKVQSNDTIIKRIAAIKKTKDEKYGGKYTFSEDARKNIGQAQLGNEKHAKTWAVILNTGEVLTIKNIAKWYRETGNIHQRNRIMIKNAAGEIIGRREQIGTSV